MSSAPTADTASGRPLNLKMRGDVEVRAQTFGGRCYWAVKDPVALKYFHLGDEEYQVWRMLDGRTSLDDLKRRCDVAFAPRRLTIEQLLGFLAILHRFGLVQADSTGQGSRLLDRRDELRRHQNLESLLSLLAIRFPGVDPSRLLDALSPLGRWLFSPGVVGFWCLAAMAAATLFVVQFESVEAKLPHLDLILAATNIPWLVITLAFVKILHELGHGLACRRFGSECHEMGLMFLVFSPCLYCNVSDSWMLPSKWQRIGISAAGIYVEIILASACAFLWWFSQPGLFHSLCLNIVLVCSLGTLFLNGNPLLRYDGYFILADLIEVPNLKAQSSDALRRLLSRYCLGIELPPQRLAPIGHDRWLALYAVAATSYRILMAILVLWMLDRILRPLHLQVLVLVIAGIVVGGFLWPVVGGFLHWARNPSRRRYVAPARLTFVSLIVGMGMSAILWVPLPARVSAPVVVEFQGAERVYVTAPGRVVDTVEPGQKVREGQQLARLENLEVNRDLARIKSERDHQKLLVDNLEAQRLEGSSDGSELPAAKAALLDLEHRLEQTERDADQLSLRAPRDGVVLPPPNVPREPHDARSLPTWFGTPLDKKNRGAALDNGTLFCLIGDPDRFEAILHIDEQDIELVQKGQYAQVRLDHLPGEVITGTVAEIAKLDLEVMPRELSASGDVPAETDARGIAKPIDTWYQARVQFDRNPRQLVGRMHGRARIEVAPRTLADRIVRYLRQTFAK